VELFKRVGCDEALSIIGRWPRTMWEPAHRSTHMEQHQPLSATSSESAVYQIKVQGQLSANWCAWFDGMTITQDATGATLITGPVADQAALHGLLRKVRDLGLTLLALSSSETRGLEESAADSGDPPGT
jgi:hypothetical protein